MIYFDKDKKAYAFEIENFIATIDDETWAKHCCSDDWDIIDGAFTDISETDEYKAKEASKEKERVAMLKMTPLDFLKAIQKVGVTYAQIKALCDANAQVDMELRFCNHVYRGNPLLDQLASQFNVTSEQLDELFKTYGE